MKPKTYHEGAADERRAILRKMRREASLYHETSTTRQAFEYLMAWILDQRYKARPGGLGRKRKAK